MGCDLSGIDELLAAVDAATERRLRENPTEADLRVRQATNIARTSVKLERERAARVACPELLNPPPPLTEAALSACFERWLKAIYAGILQGFYIPERLLAPPVGATRRMIPWAWEAPAEPEPEKPPSAKSQALARAFDANRPGDDPLFGARAFLPRET